MNTGKEGRLYNYHQVLKTEYAEYGRTSKHGVNVGNGSASVKQ